MELNELLAELHRRLEVQAEEDCSEGRWGAPSSVDVEIRLRRYQENLIERLVNLARL